MQLRQLHWNFLNEMKLLYDDHEASVITSMVFESVLGMTNIDLISKGTTVVNSDSQSVIDMALEKLNQHIPVQYVTGTAWFYGLPFIVRPAVLIPRPETEELVSMAIHFCEKENKKSLIDIGTGSGCIPISIKTNLPHLNVSALDVSCDALYIAKENAKKHAVEIDWLEVDFLDESSWQNLSMYDVIVSNPPYIPLEEKAVMDKNVTAHEPHLALFVPDERPLIFYEKIALFGKNHLASGGAIFLETHEKYAGKVAALFNQNGYDALVHKDFYEKERMVTATRSR